MFEEQKIEDIKATVIATDAVLMGELEAVDFDKAIDETEYFAIRPTIVVERSGQRLAVYGIYNKETNVREAESRQLGGAKEWLRVLTEDRAGDAAQEDLPGLGVMTEMDIEGTPTVN